MIHCLWLKWVLFLMLWINFYRRYNTKCGVGILSVRLFPGDNLFQEVFFLDSKLRDKKAHKNLEKPKNFNTK